MGSTLRADLRSFKFVPDTSLTLKQFTTSVFKKKPASIASGF